MRRGGNFLIGAGLAVLLYAGVILFWGDPVTWVWSHYKQRELTAELNRAAESFRITPLDHTDDAAALAYVRRSADTFERQVELAHAFGRLQIGRIGLSVVVVHGTDRWRDLVKGPGHYEDTDFPGQGRTVAIAGHRTTFGAWFRHIDSIQDGDYITLQMPYATFKYRVEKHQISNNNDRAALIGDVGYDRLMLSACHPLYSASQRWIVFARAVSVTLPDGYSVRL